MAVVGSIRSCLCLIEIFSDADDGQGKGSNSVAVGRDFTKGAGLQTVNTINQDYGGESSKGMLVPCQKRFQSISRAG
jgi:hypothetical protein